MVHGNEDAISFFENNQSTVKDPALKTLIADALPSLHAQHDIMKQLQAGLEK